MCAPLSWIKVFSVYDVTKWQWRLRNVKRSRAFCVLQFVKHESVVSVQRAFRRQFSSDPPSPNSIRRWYQQFQTTGCLCKGKSAGRPRVSEESVERVRQSFLRSTKKSVWFLCIYLQKGKPCMRSCFTWFISQTKSFHLTIPEGQLIFKFSNIRYWFNVLFT